MILKSLIKDQKNKKAGKKETAKNCETREVSYTCKYTSGHLIPNSVYNNHKRIRD